MLEIAQSVDRKVAHALQLEDFLSWKDKQSHFLSRHVEYSPMNNVIACLGVPEGRDIVEKWLYGANLVTDDGDIFYAKQAVAEAPSANEDFFAGRMELNNPGIQDTPAKADDYSDMTTPITASRKVFETSPNYPLRDDADGDNTGAGVDVVTYLNNYTTGDFDATGINGGAIHDNASPTANTSLLTHFVITAFAKTTSDTLKMFVNHTMNGV